MYKTTTDLTSELHMVKSDVRLLVETMQQGFKRMDERFEMMDRRFDETNRRFTYIFAFLTAGFTILIVLMSLYRFVT